jgi:hypothetical protein
MVIEGLEHSMANVNAQLRTQYVWFKKSICPLRVSLQLGCNQYYKYTIPKTFLTMCHNLEVACSMLKPIDQQLENAKIQHSTWLLEILLVSLKWGESFNFLHNVACRRLVILKDKM